ncbi:hypothetical protein D3C81_1016570 [compost metagenome]
MDVVNQVIRPDAPRVLVKAHGPEGDHLALRVRIQFGQGLELLGRHAGFLGGTLKGVRFYERRELLKVDVTPGVRLGRILGLHLQWVIGTQAVADVIRTFGKFGVFADKILVDRAAFNDVVGNVIEDEKISLWLEHHGDVSQLKTAMLKGRQYGHLDVGLTQSAIRHPAPKNRVHLRHV